jgi:hypothetical protein
VNLLITIPPETLDALRSALLSSAQAGLVKPALTAYLAAAAEVAAKAATLQLGEQLVRQASLTCRPVADLLGTPETAGWVAELTGDVYSVEVKIALAE